MSSSKSHADDLQTSATEIIAIARSVHRDIDEDAARQIVERADLVSVSAQDLVLLARERGVEISLEDAEQFLGRAAGQAQADIAVLIEQSGASVAIPGKWS